jgi:ATP-dependent RNA helicase DHX29
MSLLLLCGEAEFKVNNDAPRAVASCSRSSQLISDSAFVDRNKIRFRVDPKSNIALKHLRSQLGSLLSYQFRGKPLTESQILWNNTAMMVLGKMKHECVEDDDRRTTLVVS